MAPAHIHGQMARSKWASGSRTRSAALEHIHGLMAGNTKVNGSIIICTARVFTRGKTGVNTTVIINLIRSMDMEYTPGLMEGDMKETGHTESSMERASIYFLMVQ
jgi:hypothetical protein